MNILDNRRMIEGLSYNFTMLHGHTDKHIEALIKIRDIMRDAGLHISAFNLNQLIVRDTTNDMKHIATGLFI